VAGDGCHSPARPGARRCPLPAPFHRGVGILSGQGVGKFHPAIAGGKIGLMCPVSIRLMAGVNQVDR
jgi:hypothetical protein